MTASVETGAPARRFMGRTGTEWLVALPTITLLLLVLVISTGEMVHGQLLRLGENVFGDKSQQIQYYMLRADMPAPTCDANMDVEAEVARRTAKPAAQSDDPLDNLLEADEQNVEALRRSLTTTLAECKERHEWHDRAAAHTTPVVKFYRTVETSFYGLFRFGTENRPMILLLLMAVTIAATTLTYEHLSLVPARYAKDFQMQAWLMLASSGFLLWSSVSYYNILSNSGIPVEDPNHHYAWMVFFSLMVLIGLYQVVRPRKDHEGPGTWNHAMKASPLAASMTIFAGAYFWLHNHPSGLAIYVNTLMEFPMLPLQLALFIWGGMLFKQSRLIDMFMNLLRPWKLSPEALTYLILLAAAVPTAYTGGSGAFVMAAGAIIYHEVRSVGGSSQYALAASAMSGSLGVVLRPSLLVVAIVAVNKEVTSNELFHWGAYVFILTSTLFFLASQMRRTEKVKMASPSVAFPEMLRNVPPILPHIAVVLAIAGFYAFVLDTPLNEISAPTVMPVMMILIVMFDKMMLKRGIGPVDDGTTFTLHREKTSEASIRVATTETVGHLGGYMFLILLSQALGGVIERSGIIHLAPSQFSAPWVCMTFLAVSLVVLGMFMEPLGAIFLVSGTLAPMALANGIDPIHFWMMVLVAFELGYLMPPVALNQLLARQVVGDDVIDQADREVAGQSYYRRYERWILPCAVMTVGLALVSYLPFIVNYKDTPWLKAWLP
ncbi:MAG: TRAP transporter large permease subunit [Rubrivivax sp.]|nr:MAG: TRAP transporter large permease subunit [Rubrivivax sp.]